MLCEVTLPFSKSIANRLAVLYALSPFDERLKALVADNDDTAVMLDALSQKSSTIDIGHAGTAMRFLTAYFAFLPNVAVTITGSDRMKQRPIFPLVNALKQASASIKYLGQDGFPPLRINGVLPTSNSLEIEASLSSQFVSALAMQAARFKGGLRLNLKGELISEPYFTLTLAMLKAFGAEVSVCGSQVEIKHEKWKQPTTSILEADWSAAAPFYALLAVAKKGALKLKGLGLNSLQGDSQVASLFQVFGVQTKYQDNGIEIFYQNQRPIPKHLNLDFKATPDLVQSFIVCAAALGCNLQLSGLQTLRIKETDRLLAMQQELKQFDCVFEFTPDGKSAQLDSTHFKLPALGNIQTYNDHRMAFAFAPLISQKANLNILNPEVVSKSFPLFWQQFDIALHCIR